jgi:transcription elongation factor Elf1
MIWLLRCPYCGHEQDLQDMVTCTDFWIELECPVCHRMDDTSENPG